MKGMITTLGILVGLLVLSLLLNAYCFLYYPTSTRLTELARRERNLHIEAREVAEDRETIDALREVNRDREDYIRRKQEAIEKTIRGRNSTWQQGKVIDIQTHAESYHSAVIVLKEENGNTIPLTVNRNALNKYIRSLVLMNREGISTAEDLIGKPVWYCINDGWLMSEDDGRLPDRSLAIVVE